MDTYVDVTGEGYADVSAQASDIERAFESVGRIADIGIEARVCRRKGDGITARWVIVIR